MFFTFFIPLMCFSILIFLNALFLLKCFCVNTFSSRQGSFFHILQYTTGHLCVFSFWPHLPILHVDPSTRSKQILVYRFNFTVGFSGNLIRSDHERNTRLLHFTFSWLHRCHCTSCSKPSYYTIHEIHIRKCVI